MADNVDITPGTGATVAADEVGGALYQRVKLAVGADGAAADLAPGQAAMAASLPVAIANNQSAVPVSFPAANLGQQAMAASVSTVPANNITDATYIGDIKFGEALPAGSAIIGATKDAGVSQTVTRTYTTSADLTTAAAISPAPGGGEKLVAIDVLVSSAVASEFSIQEETSATVFASVFLPANGSAQITLRGGLKTAVADKKFFGKMSAAGNVRVTCITYSEA